ncbi:ribosomal RNA small subunit methyltransferase I [Mycobacterium montefiorense]|uniref:Ribosomal RNA small subunit methyltransferase I n=2 Tax=Mycobacterium montefiorense TaxID=154654 RepID=A0AA37UVW7_9MYCO|nr:ribosomal RNA small subunit methyltransferase I [Mycobacterium montefiorense]GKU43795.1 ribosomal RNA small subunit methyltransferase I [Mycobacterium montefiorense]GKU52713.1 ribosomal RNA small subunit methyltransferase I [Mycobacterium montefiorense]GKU55563.1 ribosomal RNA small subunit methyltransferase I [Mycobacterium montefiorense]GKU63457.1 ribosomal RNA small subunit methyltransferase I [Mycobacterium montefiorense]
MPVTTQPRMWSSGPKSAVGTNGPGLTTGTTRSSTALRTFKEASLGGADIGVDRRLSVMSHGRLLLGATPLGQPSDASPRLIRALGEADVVAAEDTRRVRTLAKALDIRIAGRVVSMFDQVEAARVPALVDEIRAGATVLVVSDAGMPLISDPGYRMVAACVEAGVPVTCLPGPSAVTTALAVSGLPSEKFCFEGFAPRKSGARKTWLDSLADERRTCVFFESPRRLAACLLDAVDQLGGSRPAAICRELTKVHEEVVRGSLQELAAWAADGVLGEITVVLAGASPPADVPSLVARVQELVAEGVRVKDACTQVAAANPAVRSRQLYDEVLRSRRAD